MHIIFFVHDTPRPVGNGSHHRAYQVAHDLRAAVGEERFTLFDYSAELASLSGGEGATGGSLTWRQWLVRVAPAGVVASLRRGYRALRQLVARARLGRKLLWLALGGPLGAPPPGPNRVLDRYADPRIFARYRQRVAELPRPLICVVRHSSFARLAWFNARLGIRTVACPANLEAFDVGAGTLRGSARECQLTALDFSDELRALAACDARLFISRVETGLVNGLGFPSHYYPYQPVGEIAATLQRIRAERRRRPPVAGLLVMLGSGYHPTTGASFRWFLRQTQRYGLPAGVRLVVCGHATDRLLAPAERPAHVELRGWVEQAELDALLATAQGVLLPQQIGFGGLTRLAELACAGIPCAVSEHASYAITPLPPGVVPVADEWAAWWAVMQQLPAAAETEAYQAWAAQQDNPWQRLLAALDPDATPPPPSGAAARGASRHPA